MRLALVFFVLALAGLAVWMWVSVLSGEEEAWDSALYFMYGLPIMIVIPFAAGYFFPRGSGIWGVAIVAFQPIALLRGAGLSPFLLVGIFTFALLAMVCTISSLAGYLLRRRVQAR